MRIGRTSSRSGRRSSIGLEDSGLLMQRACAFQCHLGNSVFASSERDAAARTELVCRTGFASGRLASRGISRRLSELATAMAMRPSATRARQGRTLPAESWKSASHAHLVRAVALTDLAWQRFRMVSAAHRYPRFANRAGFFTPSTAGHSSCLLCGAYGGANMYQELPGQTFCKSCQINTEPVGDSANATVTTCRCKRGA